MFVIGNMGAGKSSLLNRLVYMIKNYQKNKDKAKKFMPDEEVLLTPMFKSSYGARSLTVKV